MSNIKTILSQDNVKKRFEEILKDRAVSFTANLAVMVNNSDQLQQCDPMSIVSCAVVAASLDLPLDPNLGFAAIVPYSGRNGKVAQFQIMYKGLIQLCLRSGQYQTISATEIYEGQLVKNNPLTGFEFDFDEKKSDKIIGYAAYFKTVNGFEKTIYSPVEKLDAHGKRFSKTYQRGFGLWKDDFHSMCLKTVIKQLLNTWGIKSIEMQKAIRYDQSTVNQLDGEPEFVDAETVPQPQIEENPQVKQVNNDGAAEQ